MKYMPVLLIVWVGVCIAVVASIIWAGAAIITGYEIGYAALGLGALIGYVLSSFKGRKFDKILPILAGVLSLFGILLGFYTISAYRVFKDTSLDSELFGISPVDVLFSLTTVQYVIENFSVFFSYFIVVWLIIAVSIAYRITRSHVSKEIDTSSLKSPIRRYALLLSVVVPILCVLILSFISNKYSGVSSAQYEAVLLNSKEAYEANELGLRSIEDGDFLKAEELFRESFGAAVVDSTRVLALKNLAFMYLYTGSTTQATEVFNEALLYTTDQSFSWNIVNGMLEHIGGNSTSSLEYLTKAHNLRPMDFEINALLANFYLDVLSSNPQLYDRDKLLYGAQNAKSLARNIREVKHATETLIEVFTTLEMYKEAVVLFESLDFELSPEYYLYVGLSYIETAYKLNEIDSNLLLKGESYIDRYVSATGQDMPEEIQKQLKALQQEVSSALVMNEESISDNNVVDKIKVNHKIQELLGQYEEAEDNFTKGNISYFIAIEYSNIDDVNNAVKYYRLSSSHFPIGSVDYYDALAQAEWELQNGTKVLEYLKAASDADPENDYILHDYGLFLLGIGVTSAPYQNLNKSLEINKKLVDLLQDDASLLNLYLNYIMLGYKDEANKLVGMFEDFDNGHNYLWIARAYHRIGNKTQSEKYLKLSKEKGYILDKYDNEFFDKTF